MADVTNIRPGRWGLARIVEDEPRAFTVAAMVERLGSVIEAYYPPLNATKAAYTLPFALVRLPQGATRTPSSDVRLFPNLTIDQTLGQLNTSQRNAFRTQLEEWLQAYSFTDWDATLRTLVPFSGATYTTSTPIRQVVIDVYRHLAHTSSRPKPIVPETHNTEYLDNFDTDTLAANWTQTASTWAWDSGTADVDAAMATARGGMRYSANGPGSVEHEAQATGRQGIGGGADDVGFGSCRFSSAGANDRYYMAIRTDDQIRFDRLNAGTRTILSTVTAAFVNAANDYMTQRMACSGAVGADVVIDVWFLNHGATKPSDPGWIGVDATPNRSFTDSGVDRLDDAVHEHCGIAYHGAGGDWDPQYDFFKQRAISDRGGAATRAYAPFHQSTRFFSRRF